MEITRPSTNAGEAEFLTGSKFQSSTTTISAASKKLFLGGTAFTSFMTVLVVCLVFFVFSENVSTASAADITSPVTLHILDTSTGFPASGVYVELEMNSTSGWSLVGSTTTGTDGRSSSIVPDSYDVSEMLFTCKLIAHFVDFFVSNYLRASIECYSTPRIISIA
jgi:5-hydroxyisourate hydrolase-like protein (transthyretin family)